MGRNKSRVTTRGLTKSSSGCKIKRQGKIKIHSYRVEGFFDYVEKSSAPSSVLVTLRKLLKREGLPEVNFELSISRVDGESVNVSPPQNRR